MSKKVIYCYPAVLRKIEDGFDVLFPDFKGLETKGKETLEAIENSREVLAMHIDKMLKEKQDLPDPSEAIDIVRGKNDFVVLVDTNINVYRFKNKHKAVTRAVTLPQSLNEKAKASDINVSLLLQEALKEKLNIKED